MPETTRKRILVVEDDDNMLKLLEILLRRWGFDVQTAMNGVEALEALRQTTFDGMTLGIRMPRMNGLEALRQFRQADQNMPVVIISGAGPSLDDTAKDFLKNNAQDFLAKPVYADEFRKVVERWFGSVGESIEP